MFRGIGVACPLFLVPLGAVWCSVGASQIAAFNYPLFKDSVWMRASDMTLVLASVLFFASAKLTEKGLGGLGTFATASALYYASTLVSFNVMFTMLAKYNIKGDPTWGPNAVILINTLLTVMVGRISGPIVGEYCYFHLGSDEHPAAGYGAFLVAGTVLTVILSVILLQ